MSAIVKLHGGVKASFLETHEGMLFDGIKLYETYEKTHDNSKLDEYEDIQFASIKVYEEYEKLNSMNDTISDPTQREANLQRVSEIYQQKIINFTKQDNYEQQKQSITSGNENFKDANNSEISKKNAHAAVKSDIYKNNTSSPAVTGINPGEWARAAAKF